MSTKKLFSILILMLLVQLPLLALAKEHNGEDLEIFGLEVEKLLAFVSAHLAAALAILILIAYARTRRNKLLFVAFAFFQ